jgi:branched-chain amino acid transport system substrate-binding protein
MQFTLAAGVTSDNVFSIDLWSPRLPYVGARKYFYNYVFRYLSSTNYHGAQAYACMQVIADALKRTKSLTPEDVRQALAETDMQTAFGPVSFVSEDKKTQQNFARTYLGQWQSGTLEIVWPAEFASAQYVYPVPQWQENPEKEKSLVFPFSLH